MIPKKAYVSWVHKNIVNSKSLLVEYGLRSFIYLNPDWEVVVNDNEEPLQYLKENLDTKTFGLFKEVHIVEVLDAWRLIKLYQE
jgi:hypothetical protein